MMYLENSDFCDLTYDILAYVSWQKKTLKFSMQNSLLQAQWNRLILWLACILDGIIESTELHSIVC